MSQKGNWDLPLCQGKRRNLEKALKRQLTMPKPWEQKSKDN